MQILLVLLLLWPSFIVQAQITSTFDTDADGWTALNATAGDPVYISAGGNPGGFLQARDGVGGVQSKMVAPAKFLGNRSFSYGEFLRFDLKVALVSNVSNNDIEIYGGGTSIVRNVNPLPNTATWTTYSQRLHEDQLWRIGSTAGPIASKEQVKQVLASITAIHIGVEYNSVTFGPTDIGMIDNVVLEQRILPPAPSITSFAPSFGESGTSITITGSNFGSTPSNNTVYFGSIASTITNASATSLTVTVPAGAMYGSITAINKTTGLAKQSVTPFTPTFNGGGRIIPASFDPKFDINLDPAPGNRTNGLAMGDLDGDGWNDIAVSEGAINDVTIYRNLGAGGDITTASFAPKFSLTTAGNQPGLYFHDLDNDGKLDIMCGYDNGSTMTFGTYRNISTPGNLVFEAVEVWPGLVYSGSFANAVDVDGDGLIDLMAQHGNGSVFVDFWISQNISTSGNIEFAYSISYFGSSILDAGAGVSAGDLDNDGKPEMIVKHSFGNAFSIIKNTSTPGTISFGTPVPFSIGSNGIIVIADFNLDGKNDLAWKQGFSNDDIRIRINTDIDGILTTTDFATEVILDSDLFNYGGMSIADINGDGKPDIIATDQDDIAVFENVYSGGAFSANSFVSAYQLPGGGSTAYPTSPITGDINGDGKPELLFGTTNTTPPRVSIFENKNIRAPVISLTTVSPLAAPIVATVTITGNNFSPIPSENKVWFGAVEATVLTSTSTLITAQVPAGASYAPVSVTKAKLTSRYHLPFGTTFSSGVAFDNTHFAAPISFTLTGAQYDINNGDLNRDGKPDILVNGSAGASYAFRNTHSSGAISISSLMADDTLSNFSNSRLEDFDGDGYLDVATVTGRVKKNNSTLTEISFQPEVSIPPGGSTVDFADFNNDGKTDMTLTTDLSGQFDLLILENWTTNIPGNFVTGAFGSFSQNISFAKPSAYGATLTGDFDGDGFADIVTTNPGANNISLYRNLGVLKVAPTQFAPRVDVAVGDNPDRIYKGDFDIDGKLDLMLYHATGTSTTLLIVLHNTSTAGNISFSRIDLTNPSVATVAHIADLDGDGKPEIITTSEAGNRFSIFKNIHTSGALTAASFAAPFNTTVTAPRGITTADLNLDGKPEIIITRAAGLLLVYENLIPSVSITFATQPVNTTICEGSNTTFSVVATGDTNLQYKWQIDNDGFDDLTNGAPYSGVTTSALTLTNPALALTGSIYRCLVKGDNTSITPSTWATLIVNGTPVLVQTGVTVCTGVELSRLLIATAATPAASFNITSKTVSSGLTDSGNASVPAVGVASNYIFNDTYFNIAGGTVSYRVVPVSATGCAGAAMDLIFTIDSAPVVAPNLNRQVCSGNVSGLMLSNDPGSRSGQLYNILSISVAPGLMPNVSNAAAATNVFSDYLANDSFTNSTNGSLNVRYTVEPISDYLCLGDAVDVVITVFPLPCSNQPPVISASVSSVPIEGVVTIDLISLLTDADNNLDLSTLRVLAATSLQGASAVINNSNQLVLDYGTILFSGTDRISVEVCDLFGECTQQELTIEVVGNIEVFNALSPNEDGLNDIFKIEYIDLIPETQNNKVSIFNRWGSKVFEVKNYNNNDRFFKGLNDNGNELPSGTYFYKIEFASGRKPETGYISLKR